MVSSGTCLPNRLWLPCVGPLARLLLSASPLSFPRVLRPSVSLLSRFAHIISRLLLLTLFLSPFFPFSFCGFACFLFLSFFALVIFLLLFRLLFSRSSSVLCGFRIISLLFCPLSLVLLSFLCFFYSSLVACLVLRLLLPPHLPRPLLAFIIVHLWPSIPLCSLLQIPSPQASPRPLPPLPPPHLLLLPALFLLFRPLLLVCSLASLTRSTTRAFRKPDL